jgi:signal transduction histidine kinase
MRLGPRSVRGSAVTAAVVVMLLFGLALGTASFILVTRIAVSSLEDVVSSQAEDVRAQLEERPPGSPSHLDLESVEAARPVLVQVVRDDGLVVAQSSGIATGVSLCAGASGAGRVISEQTLDLGEGPSQVLQEVRAVTVDGRAARICAVASLHPVQLLQRNLLIVFVIGLPLVLLGVALSVWMALNRALGSVEDLRRQAEAMQGTSDGVLDVRSTGDEIENLGRTLNDLLVRLHAQSSTTRQFIADAGHELRNPLAALRVMLEFDDEADEATLTELARLEGLVSDLLTLAKVDSQGRVELDSMDLAPILAAAVATQRLRFPGIDIVLRREQPCVVLGDARALRSALDNLVSNACRHAESAVTVSTAVEQGRCVIMIDDDGVGLAPQDCVRVFERFVRLDDARDRDEGGSGLGLAIVAAIAEAHHGSVEALPRPGGHFILRLPVAPA